MKKVSVYTDGACSGNPGIGGFCAILIYNGVEKVISGSEFDTTNNRMELKAVIEGLKALKEPCDVDLYSDSQYVVSAFTENWIFDWVNRGWKTASKSQVKNVDLWQELLSFNDKHKINFIKVKGHSDNEFNNRCDKIAVNEYKKLGVNFLFETGQETPVTLLRVIEEIGMDNVGINMDTANLILYGKANSADAITVFGKYVMDTHIKDGFYPIDGKNLGEEVKVGEGLANIPEVVKRLNEVGYTGNYIIEREIKGDQQTKDILDTKIYLEKILGKDVK